MHRRIDWMLVLCVLLWAIILYPFFSSCWGRRGGRRFAETTNCLRHIAVAVRVYSDSNNYGCYPPNSGNSDYSLEVARSLHDDGNGMIGDANVFLCPTLPPPPEGVFRCDFIFTPNLMNDLPASAIIACNVPEAFDDGIVLLYKDMHVKFVKCDKSVFVRWAQDFENGDEKAQFGPKEYFETGQIGDSDAEK